MKLVLKRTVTGFSFSETVLNIAGFISVFMILLYANKK